ncbi:unnamed protein product [Ranitomeya imitator]|uniref:Uncharacterized protein n=1 Tax=Ranitomeya imitator TaxID=111125 RepID=A0ABN9M562_9NEOB|nr:unnamed protein product [Ranitomeya imitator]
MEAGGRRELIIGRRKASIKPKCGRLVGFSSGGENPHGVKAVTGGQRCAVALWFTLDPMYRELTISLAIRDVAASWLAISSSVTGSSDQAPAVMSLVGAESPELCFVAGSAADIAESACVTPIQRCIRCQSREAQRQGLTAVGKYVVVVFFYFYDGNQGKHRVTKRGPALSNPMFTLVTGIVGRWRAVCVTALQRPNSDAAAIRIVVGIAAASLSVTERLQADEVIRSLNQESKGRSEELSINPKDEL